jgi:phosphatidylinositol glycan class N
MCGGFLMVLISVLYLFFEKKLLTTSKMRGDSTQTADDSFSRFLIGLQTGFIVLAMIVTRSSVLSLQAKKGLPRGNQIVGWIVLGKTSLINIWL